MIVMQIWRRLDFFFNRTEAWEPLALRGLRVLIILACAWVLTRFTARTLARLRHYVINIMRRRGDPANTEINMRAATMVVALGKLAKSLIWVLALVMSLQELNYKIEPLLAGLGIAGLALGLGAQTLIKDWLGGVFLFIEDQVRIGDSVTVIGISGSSGISGAVEEINLRTIVLRGETGAVHIIPNGSITALTNFTREYSYYIFETILAHRADAAKALEILDRTAADVAGQERFRPVVLAPIEVMGVDRLGDRGASIRARIKTLPSQQYGVGRELNRLVKERFDAAGIAFPPPPP
jgi:small-conductance mechanosensitive channel